MMAAASVMKASWMSSRISQRMRRRRNQCSSAIVRSTRKARGYPKPRAERKVRR